MGLKQSIVVVNEFSLKTATGGTRGATPGDYVMEYVNRGGATELLTPAKLNDYQDYLMNYVLRDEATEKADSVEGLKNDFKKLQGKGGQAFGYGEYSLSSEKLDYAAKDIQKNFKAGKTVMKTVISFTDDYLKENGIVSPDFELSGEGDYRGNIDQLKLRLAIMNGMHKVSRYYDDLQYIGAIHVDTKKVHCHLAMYDRGAGTIMPDGTQRGKLTSREMRDIRRGIDMFLDEKQTVKMMASNVQYNKQNTVGYIKRYTYRTMNDRGFVQLLMACLPEDRDMWRAGSKAEEMQRPNEIVREYVEQVLAQPDSGYDQAMNSIESYASYRHRRENLSGEEYRKLVSDKHDEIVERGMNAVYSILAKIPEEDLEIQTPFLDMMSMPYDEVVRQMQNEDNSSVFEFGFRLRTYRTRLDHHTSEYRKWHTARVEYENLQRSPNPEEQPDPVSIALYDFYNTEEQYNEMLMNKYQYFLDFIPPEERYRQGFDELMDYESQIVSLQRMLSDTDMRRMNPDTAEEHGLRAYNTPGGQYMRTNPSVLTDRLAVMQSQYETMRDRYETEIAGYGITVDENGTLSRHKKYEFDDIKALDIHHMIYDFPYDFAIPQPQTEVFVAMADRRYSAYNAARGYLLATGQQEVLEALPEQDIRSQMDMADRFRVEDTQMHTVREQEEELEQKSAAKTIRLDYDFYTQREDEMKEDIKFAVQNVIQSLQYE